MSVLERFLYISNSFTFNYPLKEADIVFLGIPFSSTSISEKSMFGPTIVRECMKLIEGFSDDKNGIDIFSNFKFCDLGNIEVVPGNYFLTRKRIKETLKEIKSINKEAFLIIIGGEHLISLPVIEFLKPDIVIQFDAHADMRKDYLGEKYSHATWAYHASKISKIIRYGVRSYSKEEKILMEKNKKEKKVEKTAYITIDMDVFSPEYVDVALPVFDKPEKALSPNTFFDLIEDIFKKYKIVGMDITEINGDKILSKTGFLACEIIKKAVASLNFFSPSF